LKRNDRRGWSNRRSDTAEITEGRGKKVGGKRETFLHFKRPSGVFIGSHGTQSSYSVEHTNDGQNDRGVLIPKGGDRAGKKSQDVVTQKKKKHFWGVGGWDWVGGLGYLGGTSQLERRKKLNHAQGSWPW